MWPWKKSSKRKPRITLIMRAGGRPKLATLPPEERAVALMFKSIEYLVFLQLAFMAIAYFLVLLWPPYHAAFAITNWIADIMPHSIFGVLTVTQAELDAVGATLPREAYIHFVVEQIIVAMIYIFWPLIICRKAWRLYPHYDSWQRRVFINVDEYRDRIQFRRKLACVIFLPCLTAIVIWAISSPNFLLMLIEKSQQPGLVASQATATMWGGVNILLFVGYFIIAAREYYALFRGEWALPKN